MADKFGRHKSARWVRASLPSYGDEWNDEDYEYGSSEDENVKSPDLNNVVAERFVIPDQSPVKSPTEKLVLSIDKLRTDVSDESDDNEEMKQDNNEMINEPTMQDPKPSLHDDDGKVTETILTTSGNPDLEPPTPLYSSSQKLVTAPETPLSEQSFQSDTDSIQNETDLRVGHAKSSLVHEVIPEVPTEKHGDKEVAQDVAGKENVGKDAGDMATDVEEADQVHNSTDFNKDLESGSHDGHIDDGATTDEGELGRPPLVLSIDHRNYNDSSDSDEDPIPYYEKKLDQVHTDSEAGEADDGDNTDTRGTEDHSQIDSFINDLQNTSRASDKEMLPRLDTDISLPDFENHYSYYDYDDDRNKDIGSGDDGNYTPIAPLATKDEQKIHEQYVQGLGGHKPSVRKPPSVTVDPPTEPQHKTQESGNYSHFADAVDEYMSDRGSEHTGDRNEEELNGSQEDISADSSNTRDTSENLDIGEQGLAGSSDLHPVASTGSLSTGKGSIDPRGDFFEPPQSSFDKNIGRRDSTMSTNTLSMGGWKPNTNNFRDQFINDNDNESAFNFNMENETSSGYQRFVRPRTVSDNMSFISASSIPETIDAPLPEINEDEEDAGNETFSSENQTSNDTTNGLGITTQESAQDSILDDHAYEDGRFQEKWSSEETVPQPKTTSQKYSSLLDPVTSEENVSSKRMVSEATDSTGVSSADSSSIVPSFSISGAPTLTGESKALERKFSTSSAATDSTKKTFPPSAYPVSNWKAIMKPSQPQDRIALLKEALVKEYEYDTGLQTWLNETLTKSDNLSTVHIGRIASQAYQNAAHNDLRRHVSIRSRVSSVKDKVETSGLQASNFGKKFFNRGKKLMRSSN